MPNNFAKNAQIDAILQTNNIAVGSTLTTTYAINMIDSETAATWMNLPTVRIVSTGPQDSGKCVFIAATTDAAALETALDTDDECVSYEVVDAVGATTEQLSAIRAHAVNDVTRDIMEHGITLTHEQADELGQEALAWIGGRLGLNVAETSDGVLCTPPKHYTGDESRRLGITTHEER